MSAPRLIKETKVEKFQKDLTEAQTVVLADYKGLTVHEMEDLRLKLREAGGKVKVLKNTLARVAFNNIGVTDMDGDLAGQTAFVFSTADPVAGTKVAFQFDKKTPTFKIRSGYFEGKRMDLDAVKALANLPSREELLSQFVGTLLAPLSEYVATLVAPMTEFIGTLEAKAAKMEG